MRNSTLFLGINAFVFFLFFCCAHNSHAQTWEQLNDAPFIDHHTNGYGVGDVAWVFRGIPTNDGNGSSNEVWTYTPATDSWEYVTRFPGPARRISIGDDWNGKYYYGFGIGGPDGLLSDLWEFDPVDTSFTQLPSCPCTGRSHPSLIAENDKIWMGAGSANGGDVKDWWEYDMITQEWRQLEDIPGTRRHHMFHFSLGDHVYVGGGHVFNWNRYDPMNEEWTPIDDTPGGRVAGTQFQYNGLGFLLAGDDFQHSHVPDFETFMAFDPETGEWNYLPPLPNGSRWAPASFIVNGQVYFMCGLSDIIDGDASMWTFNLDVLSCLPPDDLEVVDITENSAGLLWRINQGSDSDTLKWRIVGEEAWNEVVDADALYQLTDLEPCQEYEFQISKVCDEERSLSETITFRTLGCGACLDLEYCDIEDILPGQFFFINKIAINGDENISGNNNGYQNFENVFEEELEIGRTFSFTLEPGFNTGMISFVVSVWIDLNGNGEFENDEKVYFNNSVEEEITADIMIPETAIPGTTRMRVYFSSETTPCTQNTTSFGEAEDYCLNLIEMTTSTEDFENSFTEIQAYPNPFQNTFMLTNNTNSSALYDVRIMNVVGQQVHMQRNYRLGDNLTLSDDFESGLYIIVVENETNRFEKRIIKK